MADPRFFDNKGPFSVAELSALAGDDVVVRGDGSVSISDVAPLDAASENHISFLDNRKYIEAFEASAARACIVAPELADRAPDGMRFDRHPKAIPRLCAYRACFLSVGYGFDRCPPVRID